MSADYQLTVDSKGGVAPCSKCKKSEALYVELDYHRDHKTKHGQFCKPCKDSLEMETCECCDQDGLLSCETEDGVEVWLHPVYRPGVLDADDMCGDHP